MRRAEIPLRLPGCMSRSNRRHAGTDHLRAGQITPACLASQADHGLGFDRASGEDHAGRRQHALPLGQLFWQPNFGRPVEDNAQCPFLGVLQDEDDGAIEVRIPQLRCGDKQLSGKAVAHPSMVHRDRSDHWRAEVPGQ